MSHEEVFNRFFPGLSPDAEVFCPCRVCPIGAHVDHQMGKTTGFALNRGIYICYKATEAPIVELCSLNFAGRVHITLKRTTAQQNDWGDYVRAAIDVLSYHGYKLVSGFVGIVIGTLPVGGVASSSAVILSYLVVLSRVNNLLITSDELVEFAYIAERLFLHLNIGKLDQTCEVKCEQDSLLYFDTSTDYAKNIMRNVTMPKFQVGIFYSGVPRSLRNSAYNLRVSECKLAAKILKGYAGISMKPNSDCYLREIPQEIFEQFKSHLPDNLRKRADHYFSEQARVIKGIAAWQSGDMHKFGQLIFDSGDSSIRNYENGSLELCELHNIAKNTPGIYGGRFAGAGFSGCYMAIVDPNYTQQIRNSVAMKYLTIFPRLKECFCLCFCDTANGISIH